MRIDYRNASIMILNLIVIGIIILKIRSSIIVSYKSWGIVPFMATPLRKATVKNTKGQYPKVVVKKSS